MTFYSCTGEVTRTWALFNTGKTSIKEKLTNKTNKDMGTLQWCTANVSNSKRQQDDSQETRKLLRKCLHTLRYYKKASNNQSKQISSIFTSLNTGCKKNIFEIQFFGENLLKISI